MFKLHNKGDVKTVETEKEKQYYLNKGYDVIDDKGKIIEQSSKNIDKELVAYKNALSTKLTTFVDNFTLEQLDVIAKDNKIKLIGENKAEKVAEIVATLI